MSASPWTHSSEPAEPVATVLRRWLEAALPTLLERPPVPDDEASVRAQLAAIASEAASGSDERATVGGELEAATAALALWRALTSILGQGADLYADDSEALSILIAEWVEDTKSVISTMTALILIREALAADGGIRLTPDQFSRRLQRQSPAHLGLPDRVELSGPSLAAFLESAHFPYGQYRVEEEQFWVTPSLRLGAAALERLARSGSGQQRVGSELLVWQPVSFRAVAGTSADERNARPFVSPSGARAYFWLGPVLTGGPLILRDADNTEIRMPLPAELAGPRDKDEFNTETRRHGVGVGRGDESAEDQDGRETESTGTSRPSPSPATPVSPRLPASHPALRRAEEALQRGDGAGVERQLRSVMSDPRAGGEALCRSGRLWEAIGRPELAAAAFELSLERGSVEGAVALSRLAEARGEGIEAAARPLDAAITRNLRSAELHSRYAELLRRLPAGWDHAPQVVWHQRMAEELLREQK